MKKQIKNKWHNVPLEDFPNGWTDEGATIIRNDKELKEYILNNEYESRADFKALVSKGTFLGKFYNIIGQPCKGLRDPVGVLFNDLFERL